MSGFTYQQQNIPITRSRTDWGAIWAGVFTFAAIWSVFGLLGAAIFARSPSPFSGPNSAGMGAGMGIWAVILSAVAMYVAGATTGRVAAVTTRGNGLIHGMVMFGLSVVSAAVIVGLAGITFSGGTSVNGSLQGPYLLNVFSTLGWVGFFSLALGWLAAILGAAGAVSAKTRESEVPTSEGTVRTMRPAA